MIRIIPVFLLLALSGGCHYHETASAPFTTGDTLTTVKIRYAKGYKIQSGNNYTILTVINPWQQANQVEFRYFLSNSPDTFKNLSANETFIKTPVHRVVCLSTTHIGYIEFLGETATIVGISGGNYVVNKEIREKIAKKLVPDVGYDENLNFELIVKLKPDVVFAYGVNSSVTNTIHKLNELGIPVVIVAEYLEESPLAKAEWIKFFASFYKLEKQVSKRFDSIASRYDKLSEMANRSNIAKPSVLLGLPWHGTWYISGGKSYIACLLADAGGNYLWSSLPFKDSQPMQLESVFEKALQADYWLNTSDATSKTDIISVDARFKTLKAFVSDHVYNNNALMSPGGGNDYYESGVMEPEIILSDLIAILHPQLLPSHEFKYYRKLQ